MTAMENGSKAKTRISRRILGASLPCGRTSVRRLRPRIAIIQSTPWFVTAEGVPMLDASAFREPSVNSRRLASQMPRDGWMNSRNLRDETVLVVATALTRYAFRSHYLYDIDSVNFALALQRFNPAVHQPHPPGYFLYVCLGMLSNAIFHDANAALVAISILASCGALAMIHSLARAWFGRTAANFAGVIFLCSPLAWFQGTAALTYIVEAMFSALIGHFCWRVYSGDSRFVLPAAAALGLAAGFRQSSLLVLAPVFLFSIRRAPRRLAWGGIGALGLVLASWIIPMLYAAGGTNAYIASLWSLWRLVPARQTIFTSSIFTSLARLCLIVAIYALCFGCAALFP